MKIAALVVVRRPAMQLAQHYARAVGQARRAQDLPLRALDVELEDVCSSARDVVHEATEAAHGDDASSPVAERGRPASSRLAKRRMAVRRPDGDRMDRDVRQPADVANELAQARAIRLHGMDGGVRADGPRCWPTSRPWASRPARHDERIRPYTPDRMSVARGPLDSHSAHGRLRVREVEPSADRRWDAYVSSHAEGLVYHTSAWLRVLRREYGQPAIGLALEDVAGGIRGVLPLMATRGLPLGLKGDVAGRRLSSLPRTPVAGPLADGRDGLAALVRAAVERTPPGGRLQLKPSECHLDGLVDEVAAQPWRITYVLDLPDRPEQLRFGNSRSNARVRSGINQAVRHGIVVRHADSTADVRAWYRLYLETMRHHAVPARPFRLFEAMWEELRPGGMMRLLLAERERELLAGSVLLMFGSTVFYAFNGMMRRASFRRANDLLQWQAITDACTEGYRRYDLGEVSEGNEGLAHFKSKWAAQPRRLQRYSYPPLPHRQDEADGAAGRLASLIERGWRAVPLGATAAAGRLAYRYL